MKILKLLLLFLIYNSIASADLTKHFKKIAAQDKSGNHSMKGIDFIYTINLNQRPEKFENCTKQLTPFGIHPYRFSAVNGWELSLETINDVGVHYDPSMKKGMWGTSYLIEDKGKEFHEIMHIKDRTYFCHCTSRGAIGIVLSHLSVLNDAYTSGYERVWIMEDDIEILRDPRLICSSIEELDTLVGKDGWDFLYTDQDTRDNNTGQYVPCLGYAPRPDMTPQNTDRYVKRTAISSNLMQIGARYGAYSMIVQRSGMKKILDFYKDHNMFLPYDMDLFTPHNVKHFCIIDSIISHKPGSPTDNGEPRYEKNQK